MSGLPIEGWIGLACGVLFVLMFIHALCTAASETDLEDDRDFAERRADLLGSEAEAFLRTTVGSEHGR
jgi:hypothetical protein